MSASNCIDGVPFMEQQVTPKKSDEHRRLGHSLPPWFVFDRVAAPQESGELQHVLQRADVERPPVHALIPAGVVSRRRRASSSITSSNSLDDPALSLRGKHCDGSVYRFAQTAIAKWALS
jgi:hypothetical protein